MFDLLSKFNLQERLMGEDYRLVRTGEYNPSRYPFTATFSLNERVGNGLKEEYFGIDDEREVRRRSR